MPYLFRLDQTGRFAYLLAAVLLDQWLKNLHLWLYQINWRYWIWKTFFELILNASLVAWKSFGQISKDNTLIDFPNSFRELQFVFGIGNYRYVFGFSHIALNAALSRMLYMVNGEWWQNSMNNKVSATFIINPTNTFVNSCYFNDIESSDYIVWCYYR